jgi:hypothetical protein
MGRSARSEQFHASEVGIVHAVQRCVRRAFLAGVDHSTGKDYSFRREWIRRRMEALASVFGIDVLTYAIMSNHLHVILRNRPDVVAAWPDEEVAIRWLRVFPGRRLEEHLAEPTENDVRMLAGQAERLALIRQRLSDISWFMRERTKGSGLFDELIGCGSLWFSPLGDQSPCLDHHEANKGVRPL